MPWPMSRPGCKCRLACMSLTEACFQTPQIAIESSTQDVGCQANGVYFKFLRQSVRHRKVAACCKHQPAPVSMVCYEAMFVEGTGGEATLLEIVDHPNRHASFGKLQQLKARKKLWERREKEERKKHNMHPAYPSNHSSQTDEAMPFPLNPKVLNFLSLKPYHDLHPRP